MLGGELIGEVKVRCAVLDGVGQEIVEIDAADASRAGKAASGRVPELTLEFLESERPGHANRTGTPAGDRGHLSRGHSHRACCDGRGRGSWSRRSRSCWWCWWCWRRRRWRWRRRRWRCRRGLCQCIVEPRHGRRGLGGGPCRAVTCGDHIRQLRRVGRNVGSRTGNRADVNRACAPEPWIDSFHYPFDPVRVGEHATGDFPIEELRELAELGCRQRLRARERQPVVLEAVTDRADLAGEHLRHELEGLPHRAVLEDVDGRKA